MPLCFNHHNCVIFWNKESKFQRTPLLGALSFNSHTYIQIANNHVNQRFDTYLFHIIFDCLSDDFSRFWNNFPKLYGNLPVKIEICQVTWKFDRSYGNLSGYVEIYQEIWKFARLGGNWTAYMDRLSVNFDRIFMITFQYL